MESELCIKLSLGAEIQRAGDVFAWHWSFGGKKGESFEPRIIGIGIVCIGGVRPVWGKAVFILQISSQRVQLS